MMIWQPSRLCMSLNSTSPISIRCRTGLTLFVSCSSKVNIYVPVYYLSTRYLLAVTHIELPSIQFPTAITDTKSLNTSLWEVMISSKNERVFIRNLSDLTNQIIFDAWWASLNIGSKRPITWNNSRDAPLWRFYLHSGSEETGSPSIICIVCHQVLCHPWEHGTSSLGQYLLAKAPIAKFNKFTG